MGVDTCSSIVEMDVYETPYENNIISVPQGESLIFISFASELCMPDKTEEFDTSLLLILFVKTEWWILCLHCRCMLPP